MKKYDHKRIERKWQDVWEKKELYKADDKKSDKEYILVEFPYPSGDGLHVGHARPYTAMDIVARKRRAEGKNVLFPIGWDAFGLPTENYAIKTGTHPKDVTKNNTDKFRAQIKSIGISFDWSREINTTDPTYYKWTQWIFLQLYKKGLAYKAKMSINWCLTCKIGLANEEVIDGKCERCGGEIDMREKEQWMLSITKYADRLHDDLEELDYTEAIKVGQRNWIGKSEGAEITFKIKGSDKEIKTFTTRPDTLFGATYMVLAPEHSLVKELKDSITNLDEVLRYIEVSAKRSEIERTDDTKGKTGVELKGVKAINPANNEEIPIYIADYVMAHYGTGAIMAVPAHDERDFAFAKKYNLEIRQVLVTCAEDVTNPPQERFDEVSRDMIIVHLRNKSTGKFALLDWHGSLEGITTAIMGGIEKRQTPEEAALTEIEEEAAIPNAKIVSRSRWITAAKYCASHKKQNRCAIVHAFMAEVDDLISQGKINEHEQSLHTLTWVDKKEILNRLTPYHQRQVWHILQNEEALIGTGFLMNSGKFDGMESEGAKEKIIKKVGGKMVTTYKLRDWVFSRQRYWGEPIPMIHCKVDGWVPVPEDQLPVELPEVEKYEPTDSGESPLANISDFVNVKCPKCGGRARRETDTMPNWAGSSWYFLRYADPTNAKEFANKKLLKEWMPVDWYNGGMEHTTLHLLYSRFWHKFLYDQKLVSSSEPYKKRTSHGLILAEGGGKMSKSKGNVVNPDEVIDNVGADTLRVYEMFMGPFEQAISWSTDNMVGSRRFLDRVWRVMDIVDDKRDVESIDALLHKTIKKVSEDVEAMKFNTAVSSLMIFINEIEKEGRVSRGAYRTFLQLLAPFAPHITEELWENIGEGESIHKAPWPSYDASKINENTYTVAVQVNGKLRGEFEGEGGLTKEQALEKALLIPNILKWTNSKKPKRLIYVPKKLINIVI
ncbi:class I tRNA ligase family protein [Patescibacteria group bacterium]|nr:class I tRNA ligase family protein [Patescibacteria group bacterium]